MAQNAPAPGRGRGRGRGNPAPPGGNQPPAVPAQFVRALVREREPSPVRLCRLYGATTCTVVYSPAGVISRTFVIRGREVPEHEAAAQHAAVQAANAAALDAAALQRRRTNRLGLRPNQPVPPEAVRERLLDLSSSAWRAWCQARQLNPAHPVVHGAEGWHNVLPPPEPQAPVPAPLGQVAAAEAAAAGANAPQPPPPLPEGQGGGGAGDGAP